MNNKLSSLLSFFALILLSIAFVFLAKPLTIDLGKASKFPDWYMTQATILHFDRTGLPSGSLVSPSLVHHPKNNTITMTTPFFVLYDENRTPWHITATNGLAFENKPKKINLWDHVIVKQMPGPKSDETILKTPEMTYYPDTAFAHSDKAVTIQQPGSIMHSIGFDAYLKKSLIKFLSRSETQYHDPGTGKSDSGNPLNVM